MSRSYLICPVCGEENLTWAKRCRACQSSLEEGTVLRARRPIKIPRSLMVAALLCAMAFAIFWTLFPTRSTGLQFNGPHPLKVLWHKFYGNYGQEWIVGEVKNQSPRALGPLVVWGEYYDETGRLLYSAKAPLDQPTLAPGQSSHFKVTCPYKEEIEQSWFYFQTKDGQQIAFDR